MLRGVVTLLVCLFGHALGYNYNNPNVDWCAVNMTCCDGMTQSPINIITEITQYQEYPCFEFSKEYVHYIYGKLSNTGHSEKFTVEDDIDYIVSGGPLTVPYRLAQFHFHWGSRRKVGSEHTIDGKSYAEEVHLVHYKASFGSLGDAVASGEPDALAVLGFFIKVVKGNNDFRGLSAAMKALAESTDLDDKFPVEVNFAKFFHRTDLLKFYSYMGSLTTPHCNEIVRWTVFKEPLVIKRRQWKYENLLLDSEGNPLTNNFRPVQPLHGRDIWRSYQIAF